MNEITEGGLSILILINLLGVVFLGSSGLYLLTTFNLLILIWLLGELFQ